MTSTMSFDVDDYTISELKTILELSDDEMTEEDIIEKTKTYIINFYYDDKRLSHFFENVQTKLLKYVKGHTNYEYEPDTEQTDEWFENQVLKQDDKVQQNKTTDRVQKIDVYDNNHMPMNREQLGVNNNVDIPVAQDTLNPNLKNVTTRFINLDSQFRQGSDSNSLSTDYTLDLSDSLNNVLSLRLYSFQIPYTWYAIDEEYGNNYFWVINNENKFLLTIPSGNYTPIEFCNKIQEIFINNSFTNVSFPNPEIMKYNKNNGKITIYLDGWIDPLGNNIEGISSLNDYTETSPFIQFFGENDENNILYFNVTLGWIMGFRSTIQPILIQGNTGGAMIKLSGPKYFILVIDDYNQNHINNGLITITELTKKLDYPSYYNSSYLSLREGQTIVPNNFDINNDFNNNDNYFNSLSDKLNYGYGNIPQVIPSAPRTLTQSQIYTINEIIKNRKMNTSFKPRAPTNSDTFSLIPIKYNGLNVGDMYVDFSGSLQDNPRIYFGPVNIDRLRVRLLDDMGRTVNLHGVDWSITLIAEILYQY
jgi:hypothetical protein